MTPTVFLLHALGASGGAWREVIAALGDRVPCVAPDLPGFGDNHAGQMDVEATLRWLTAEIASRAPASFLLVGHSMGGKFATLLAARAQAGEPALDGLAGVVLLAASPPAPEPMDEDRRATMIGWFADGEPGEDDARRFIDANVAGPLPPPLMTQAVADVRRSSPAAWTGWLERGAREDWSERVGRLTIPALIVAGADDGDLGIDNQRRLNLPHYPGAWIETVPDAAHLLPYEQPAAVARLIAGAVDRARG
ncbi:Pimeloyl-ACP methyl ester carboxylesterase [Sphingomonas gellani]|uniref:Pimeloyl-ACP methyl ester carboxylesterase n=1 Tax=Sphingomonas gellani TaxID=1166340 RepID=A0A1H8GVS2_9SPHN|nr:alpha/beta hydrolase [Sphingomonas gellani]SEN47378.1 Pimeloyl-ACP methyl ester carboxylesterase [Sphingomonas gellani]